VQIPPYEFYKKNRDEIEDKLNEKYANKVSMCTEALGVA
jgi:DNA-directed RNA polymerase subunit E'/Rpb7